MANVKTMDQRMETIKKEFSDKRFHSFGTTKLFERRSRFYSRYRSILTFLGLAVPLAVGATALSFSTESELFKTFMLPLAGGLTTFQLILSLWALVARWDEKNNYAVAAVKTNTRLESVFNRVCNEPGKFSDSEIDRLRDEYSRTDQEDMGQVVSEKEKRYGMRKALIQFQQSCPTCGMKPISMRPSKCDSCGNFPRRYNWL